MKPRLTYRVFAAALALTGLSASAQASEILFAATVNGAGLISYTTDGSGNLSAATQSVFNPATNNRPSGIAANVNGQVGLVDANYNGLMRYSGSGALTFDNGVGAYLYGGILEDASGDIFASDYHSSTIWEISPSNVATALETTFTSQSLAWDSSGNIWGISGTTVEEFSTAGGAPLQTLTVAHGGNDIAIDATGDIFVYLANNGSSGDYIDEYDASGNFLRQVASGASIGGVGSNIGSLAFDNQGNLFAAGYGSTSIYEFTPTGSGLWTQSTFATLSSGSMGTLTIENVSPGTPEPGTWVMMLTGVGAVVYGKRRHSRRQASLSAIPQ